MLIGFIALRTKSAAWLGKCWLEKSLPNIVMLLRKKFILEKQYMENLLRLGYRLNLM